MGLYTIKRVNVVSGVIEFICVREEFLIKVGIAEIVLEHLPKAIGNFFVRVYEVCVLKEIYSISIGSFEGFDFFLYY